MTAVFSDLPKQRFNVLIALRYATALEHRLAVWLSNVRFLVIWHFHYNNFKLTSVLESFFKLMALDMSRLTIISFWFLFQSVNNSL